ncbi:hypothetical protein GN244_ATG16331 [Phytophthora infestans]|uniref:Uncharacterized protein n=1 Tax=Phytophthora infestans TaxID=4787 RepID=A0A833S3L0_PHYIN|nr:hypothetical protein GN244_ATG16331 [Phytophthora infestans]KAF4133992.1 hypothetical protein GN958_ATG16837 [Phytophthora infestans]
MLALHPKRLGDLKVSISEPTLGLNQLDAVKAPLHLFKESGIVAGAFEADDMLDFNLDTIKVAVGSTFDLLKPMSVKLSIPQRS